MVFFAFLTFYRIIIRNAILYVTMYDCGALCDDRRVLLWKSTPQANCLLAMRVVLYSKEICDDDYGNG